MYTWYTVTSAHMSRGTLLTHHGLEPGTEGKKERGSDRFSCFRSESDKPWDDSIINFAISAHVVPGRSKVEHLVSSRGEAKES